MKGVFSSTRVLRCCVCQNNLSLTKRLSTNVKTRQISPQEGITRSTYKKAQSFKTQALLLNHLLDNVLYQDENVVAVNKPAGIPMHALKYDSEYLPPDVGPPQTEDVSIAAVMNPLAEILDTGHLKPAFSLYRECSGIVLFSKKPEVDKYLSKYFVHVRTQKVIADEYWGVTTGVPTPARETITFGLRRHRIDGWRVSEFVDSPSKKSILSREVIRPTVQYQVVSVNTHLDTALVRIQPSTMKWDPIQALFLRKLAPLLGDHAYSSRCKTIMGQKIIADINDYRLDTQVLQRNIRRALELRTADCHLLPLHLHCGQLTVPKSKGKKKELITITAPLPEFYLRTLTMLSLKNPDDLT